MEELHRCKCGHEPDAYILTRLTEPKFRGQVVCPECGEVVYGALWCWSKDHAAEDATEEWNKAMPEEVEDE